MKESVVVVRTQVSEADRQVSLWSSGENRNKDVDLRIFIKVQT